MENHLKYETLFQDVTDFKNVVPNNLAKDAVKVLSGKLLVVRNCLFDVLRYARKYDKKKDSCAHNLKMIHNYIQLFFEPLDNKNPYRVYEFLGFKSFSLLCGICKHTIINLNANREKFNDDNTKIEDIINQNVNQFKAMVIFFYVAYGLNCKKIMTAKRDIETQINFLCGEAKAYSKKYYDEELFRITETKDVFKNIAETVKKEFKKKFGNKSKSKLELMEKIKISHDITKTLCKEKNISIEAGELKLKLPQELPVNTNETEIKIDLSKLDRTLIDNEIEAILRQIGSKCKKYVYNFNITDYNKKLCYLWLDLDIIVKSECDKIYGRVATNSLMSTFYFFRDLALEHKKSMEENNPKSSKEFAIYEELACFFRFIDCVKWKYPHLYLRKIKELYNSIQVLFKTGIYFPKNLESEQPLYKSFLKGFCVGLIRALHKIMVMIYENKEALCKKIDDIDDFIKFNARRLKYIFTFSYIVKEFNKKTDSNCSPHLEKQMGYLIDFFSGSSSVSRVPKYRDYYQYFSLDKKTLKDCFNNNFFSSIEKNIDNVLTDVKSFNEKSLKEKIKLYDNVIEKLKTKYKTNKAYDFLDINSDDSKFKDFCFEIEEIDENQKLEIKNMPHREDSEFIIEFTKSESESDSEKDAKLEIKNGIKDKVADSDLEHIDIKYLKDVIDNFQKGHIFNFEVRNVFEQYSKLINKTYIKNNLSLEIVRDILECFTNICSSDDKNKKPIYCDFGIVTIDRFVTIYRRIIELAYEFEQCNELGYFNLGEHIEHLAGIFKRLKDAKSKNKFKGKQIKTIVNHFIFVVYPNIGQNSDYWFLNKRLNLFKSEDKFRKAFESVCDRHNEQQNKSKFEFSVKKDIICLVKKLKKEDFYLAISNTSKLINKAYLNNNLDYELVNRFFYDMLNFVEDGIYNCPGYRQLFVIYGTFRRLIELIYEIKKTDTESNIFDDITIDDLKKYAKQYKNIIKYFLRNTEINGLPSWKLGVLRLLTGFFGGIKELNSPDCWFLKERYDLFDVEVTKDEFKGYYDKIKKELKRREKLRATKSDENIGIFSDCEKDEKDHEDYLAEKEDEEYKPKTKYNASKKIKDDIKNSDVTNSKSDIDIESEENNCSSSDEEYQPNKKDLKRIQKIKYGTKEKKENHNDIKSQKVTIKKLHINCESDREQEDEDKKYNSISLDEEDDVFYSNEVKDYASNEYKNKKSNLKKRRILGKGIKETYTESNVDSKSEESITEKLINKKRRAESISAKPISNENIDEEIAGYVGSVFGNGNCLLYSVLCQITQEEFDKLVEYVEKNDSAYKDFVLRLRCDGYELEFKADSDNYLGFLSTVNNYRSNIKTKFSSQANLVRTAIVIKCLENWLRIRAKNKNIKGCEKMTLRELTDKFDLIEMSLEMIENLFSAFGKNMNIEYEDDKTKKIFGVYTKGSFIFDDYFDLFKAISELFDRPVFFYRDDDDFSKKEYIFKQPDGYKKDCIKINQGRIALKDVSQETKKEYDNYFKAEITKCGSDYILLYFSESHVSPCGLNKNGKIYSYKDIDIEINNPKQKTKNKIKIETSTSSLRGKSKKYNTIKNNKVPKLISSKDGMINFD